MFRVSVGRAIRVTLVGLLMMTSVEAEVLAWIDRNFLNPDAVLSPRDEERDAQATLTTQSRVYINSIGPIRVGMTVREASRAIGRPLIPDREQNEECFYVTPKGGPEGVHFMVTDGRIARIDISSREFATVRDARIGDTEAYIKRLYPGQVRVSQHPYDERGHYLTVIPRDYKDRNYRIIFETDGRRVTGYRVGNLADVALIEGCS